MNLDGSLSDDILREHFFNDLACGDVGLIRLDQTDDDGLANEMVDLGVLGQGRLPAGGHLALIVIEVEPGLRVVFQMRDQVLVALETHNFFQEH